MPERSAYAVLSLQKGASDQEIKQAFVNLVKKYDPEVHTDRFLIIQDAYNRLREPHKRAKEDLHTYNVIGGDLLFARDEVPQDPAQAPSDEAIEQARQKFRESSGDNDARASFIRMLMQRSSTLARKRLWNEAIQDWEEIHAIEPSHVRARNNITVACIQLGTSYALHELNDEAVDLWEKALEINPDNPDLVHNLALACERSGKDEKAARYWVEVINRWKAQLKSDPDNVYLKEVLIEAHRHHGQTNVTETHTSTDSVRKVQGLREVLELKPDDFEARFQLARQLLGDRKLDEAIRELQELSRQHPKNVSVLNMLGLAMLQNGSVEQAFQTWQRSEQIDPKDPSTREQIVRAHLALGKQYRGKGMFTPSLVHLKKLLRYMPKSAEVHMEIAATYDMKGDVRSAAQSYQQVLAIDPKNKTARKALNDLKMKR